jgi:ABC-type Na+ efflux pump permease subunit
MRLADDRESGALELLLATAISVRTIVRGQWQALWMQCGWLALAMLLFVCTVFGAIIGHTGGDENVVGWFLLCLPVAALLLVGVVWTSMWMGLRVKFPRQAPGAAVLRVVLLPWLAWIALMISGNFLGGPTDSLAPYLLLPLQVTSGLGWSLYSRFRIYRDLRHAAAHRFLGSDGKAVFKVE